MADASTVRCPWCGKERPPSDNADQPPARTCARCYTQYDSGKRKRISALHRVFMCDPHQKEDAPAPAKYTSKLVDCGPDATKAVTGSILFRYTSRVVPTSETQFTFCSCRAMRHHPEFSELAAEGAGPSLLTYLDRMSMFERFVLSHLRDHSYAEYLRQFFPDDAVLTREQIASLKASAHVFQVPFRMACAAHT